MANNFKVNSALKRALKHRLWLKQKGLCWICREATLESEGTLDHVQPTSKGGRHRDNIKLACRRCNGGRGNQLASTFAREALKLEPAHVQRILDVERQLLKHDNDD